MLRYSEKKIKLHCVFFMKVLIVFELAGLYNSSSVNVIFCILSDSNLYNKYISDKTNFLNLIKWKKCRTVGIVLPQQLTERRDENNKVEISQLFCQTILQNLNLKLNNDLSFIDTSSTLINKESLP